MRNTTLNNLWNNYNKHKTKLNIATIGLVALCTLYAFSPAFDNEFVHWDDQFYVTANPYIQNPTLQSLTALMDKVVSLNYHPLTMASLWVNAKISGLDSATPFIATNLGLHIINAALVFFLTYFLSRKKWIVATCTSLLFALHPMHVESVIWVSERKDVLYSFFLLLGLLCYTRYAKSSNRFMYLGAFGLMIAACLSKAMAVSMLPCMLLIDLWTKRDFKTPKVYLEKVPFLAIALFTGMVALNVQSGGDFYSLLTQLESKQAVSKEISLTDRFSNASFANAYYLKQFILPDQLSPYHPYSMMDEASAYLPHLASVGLIIGLLWAGVKRQWPIVFGLGFYLSTIALVLQFLPVGSTIVADRYTYLPYIGLAYITGLGLYTLVKWSKHWAPALILPALAPLMIYQTTIQSEVWQDHTSLFSQAVETYPNDAFCRKTLASGYWAIGELDSAIHHIKYAVDNLDLVTSPALELLGNCYADKKEPKKALAFLNEAVTLDSTNVTARYHRGLQLLHVDPAIAIQDFNYCEASGNAYVESLIYAPRGRSYGLLGQYPEALEDLTRAIHLFPNDVNNYLDRAVTYNLLGDTEKADLDNKKALLLEQENTHAMTKNTLDNKTKSS